MIEDDFKYNINTGLFTADESDSLLTEVVLRLGMKAVSRSKTETGKPVYQGDYFLFPEIGCNVYELKTIRPDTEKVIEEMVAAALDPVVKKYRAAIDFITVKQNSENHNRYDVTVSIRPADNAPVSYHYFYEVA